MNILRNACLVLSLTLLGGTAFAQQLVTVSCDKGSSVTISYDDARGQHNDTWIDSDGNGSVEFTVPDGITVVTVTKMSDGRPLTYKVTLSN